MKSKFYNFNTIDLNTSDGVLECIFDVPGHSDLNLSKYNFEVIPSHFFYFNQNLEKVILPKNLKRIESFSFSYCYSLKEFTIPDSVEYVHQSLLKGSEIYNDEKNWSNGVFSKDNWAISVSSETKDLILKEGIKYISEEFAKYSSYSLGSIPLNSVKLPSTLETIGDYAFRDQGFKSISIPKNVKHLGRNAISGCTSLERVELYANLENKNEETRYEFNGSGNESSTSTIFIGKSVKKIPYRLFHYTNICNLQFENGSTIEEIGKEAFNYSKLTNVTLPSTIKKIGYGAFQRSSSLAKINFDGTKAQWNAVEKGAYWAYKVVATYVQCTDGQVAI